jgi:purine-binding chemotaxis protein CheW
MSALSNPETHAVSTAAAQGSPREVLSFKLGAEEYGIDILKVQEIRG